MKSLNKGVVMGDGRRAAAFWDFAGESASGADVGADVRLNESGTQRPETEWDGMPLNPAESGAHWIQTERSGVVPMWWSSTSQRWFWFGVSVSVRPQNLCHGARYIERCVPPARTNT